MSRLWRGRVQGSLHDGEDFLLGDAWDTAWPWGVLLQSFHTKGENGPDEILGLRVFYSAGPMCLYLAALLIVRKYPITAARHAQLRAELAARGVRPPGAL